MSEQSAARPGGDAADAGTTDQDVGNLSVEDDAQGTTDPADLAGTADDGDDPQ